MLLSSSQAQAQYLPANTPDESAAGAGQVPYGVQNTGNADAVTDGTILRMMCWDGASPSLAWDYAGKKGRVSLTNAAGASTPAGLYLVRLATTQGTRTFRLRLE